MSKWMTVAEAAEECRRHRKTIERWVREGKLKKRFVGASRCLLVSRDEVDALVWAMGDRRPPRRLS